MQWPLDNIALMIRYMGDFEGCPTKLWMSLCPVRIERREHHKGGQLFG